jgi:hypothetical protein
MLVRSTNLSLLKLYVDTIPTYDGNVNTLRPGFFTFKYIYLASSCYDLESAIGRSIVITVQLKLLEGE